VLSSPIFQVIFLTYEYFRSCPQLPTESLLPPQATCLASSGQPQVSPDKSSSMKRIYPAALNLAATYYVQLDEVMLQGDISSCWDSHFFVGHSFRVMPVKRDNGFQTLLKSWIAILH
jgi:hypothetical protein